MKKYIKLFEEFISEQDQSELQRFKNFLDEYCKKNNSRDEEVHQRAISLLDEMSKDEDLNKWMMHGKTLLLQELLRKTSYKGNSGSNSKEDLLDFNAFALLDTVGMYYRSEVLDENL